MIRSVDAKIVHKRSTTASELPTVAPSNDHTDGSWSATDIYSAEFFVNEADNKLFIRIDGNINEVSFGGGGASPNIYNTDDVLTANRILGGAGFSLTLNNLSAYDLTVNDGGKATRNYTNVAGESVVEGVGNNVLGFGTTGSSAIITGGTSPTDVFGGIYRLSNQSYVDFQVYDGLGESAGFGVYPWAGAANSYSTLYFNSGATSNGFQADENGERILSQSVALNRQSTLGSDNGIAFLSGSGGTGYIGTADQDGLKDWISFGGTVGYGGIYDANGTVGAGRVVTLTDTLLFDNGKIQIDAAANGTDRVFEIRSGSNNSRMIVLENGQFFTGSNLNASTQTVFGQYHVSGSYSFGFGFYANNCSNSGFTIQGLGTTPNVLSVANQGNPIVSNLKGVNVSIGGTGSVNNYGVDSFARNGSGLSIGVRGSAGGADSVSPSGYLAGVQGNAQTGLDALQYGGYFFANAGGAGQSGKTTDNIGVFGSCVNESGATGRAIGGQFLARSSGAAALAVKNIALHVPSSNNNGIVVLGADDASANALTSNSIIEATGDIEIIGNTDGMVLEDRTLGTRHRIYLDNGVVSIEAA